MTTRAYVLITTDVGKTEAVAQGLRKLTGVKMADVVAGTYDVVAVLECTDTEAIGSLVLNQVHGMAGLKSTLTLIAVK